MNLTSKQDREGPLPAVEVQRIVHRMDQGATKTRFILHPDQVRLAQTIDAIDGPVRGAVNIYALDTAKSGDLTITRELMLTTLARYPQGILAKDLCKAILDEEQSTLSADDIKQRVYSMLKRETTRGTVKPEFGKGSLRRLTPQGMSEAAILVADIARANASRERIAKAKALAHRKGTSTVVNSAFDLGRKVQMGVINGLPAHSLQN